METQDKYISCKEELLTSAGTYNMKVINRQADFILTLPGGKQLTDNLFHIESRSELYKLLEGESVYNWLIEIKNAIEEAYVSQGTTRKAFSYTTSRFVFTNNTTGMCTLTFHEKYKKNLAELGLEFPIMASPQTTRA